MHDMAFIGESWGEAEDRAHTAFVGGAGYILNQMLLESGIKRTECLLTNVFNFRPPGNNIGYVCTEKERGISGYPALNKDGYVHRRFTKELERLANELEEANPNVIVALGNTACWAMLGRTMISKLRGTLHISSHTITGFKVLPAYHPAAIMRQWNLRAMTVMDLRKAKRESRFPEIRRPKREIWIEPTLEDIYEFDRRYIQSAERLAVDIETAGDIITCIGIAPTRDVAIVIPGIGTQRAGRAYWPSVAVECSVYKIIKDILRRRTPKVFQNGLYDIAFIKRAWEITVVNAEHDTMLLHHALQPESLKSLGFLGSVYTGEGAWKQMRKVATIKRED